MFELTLNYLVLLGAAVAGLVACFLWYSPPVFGNVWLKHSGLSKKDAENCNMWPATFGQLVANLVMGYILYAVMMWALVTSMQEALMVAFWLWLGFNLTREFSTMFWAKRSLQIVLIDAFGMLLTMLIMAGVLFQWG